MKVVIPLSLAELQCFTKNDLERILYKYRVIGSRDFMSKDEMVKKLQDYVLQSAVAEGKVRLRKTSVSMAKNTEKTVKFGENSLVISWRLSSIVKSWVFTLEINGPKPTAVEVSIKDFKTHTIYERSFMQIYPVNSSLLAQSFEPDTLTDVNIKIWAGSDFSISGGHRMAEAVELLESFYIKGNENIPEELRHRKRKPKTKDAKAKRMKTS